jgi:BirA family biotin operon repressor/biotin-[acetyl-CoA-carboxylase] ligase
MIGKPFNILTVTDSTNNHAMRLIREGKATHGEAFFALEQTDGKGQPGKTWTSETGQNIMISIVLSKNLPEISNQFRLSIVTALACHNFFNTETAGETTIKWPNDLYWRDRKAGGLLIENVISGKNIIYSVLGIGLNINQTEFPDVEKKVVSLRQITGKIYEPIDLAVKLCSFLSQRLENGLVSPFSAQVAEFNSHLFRRHEKVRFLRNEKVEEGIISHVTEKGKLCIKQDKSVYVKMGEITWLL